MKKSKPLNHIEYCAQFLPVGGIVLDVGSGKGKFLCGMAKVGYRGYGIEINPDYIVEARAKAVGDSVVIEIVEGKAEKLPYPDNYFDFVNCSEVTEHVEDPTVVLEEIKRVLKLEAKAYISFHNRFGWYDYHYHLYAVNWLPRSWSSAILRLLRPKKIDGPAGRQTLLSMHYYTYGQVEKLLATCGFLAQDIRVEKIKQKYPLLKIVLLPVYYLFLRPFYFNTFHLLLQKQKIR